jgi:hypothetical protein
MVSTSENASFSNIHDAKLKAIIAASLSEMATLLEETTCISQTPLADQLNEIKKRAFEELYAIGRGS